MGLNYYQIKKNVLQARKLDEELIFYLRSRGLNYKQAKELLVNGFLLDVVEKITDLEVKNLIKNTMGFKE